MEVMHRFSIHGRKLVIKEDFGMSPILHHTHWKFYFKYKIENLMNFILGDERDKHGHVIKPAIKDKPEPNR